MDILKISGLVLTGIILISAVPAFDKSVISLLRLSVCLILIGNIVLMAGEAIIAVHNITDGYFTSDFAVIYKSAGISVITGFVSDLAADSGNKSLANRMNFAGRAAIIALSLPLFIQVLEIIKGFTG